MQKFIIAGFVALMGLMAVASDFFMEWKDAEGAFGPREYLASFGARAEEERQAKDRKEFLARPITSFMPDAPEGWVRSEWTPELQSALMGEDRVTDFDPEVMSAMKDSTKMIGGFSAAGYGNLKAARTMVYRKGNELVFLEAKTERDEPIRVTTSFAADTLRSTLDDRNSFKGFAHSQGVSWAQKHGKWDVFAELESGGTREDEEKRRTFQTRMGDRVALQITARAEDASIREIMHAIDYVALNRLNELPMVGVSADVPVMPVDQQVFVAQRWSDQRHQQRLQQRAAALAKYESGDYSPTFLEQMITPAGAEYRLDKQRAAGQQIGLETQEASVKVEKAETVQAAAEPDAEAGGFSLLKLFAGPDKEAEALAAAEAEARAAEVALAQARARVSQLGLATTDLRVAQDGLSGKPQAEWKAASSGGLKTHHPRYDLRQHEVQAGLAPGSCVQLVSGTIYCEANAEAIRLAAAEALSTQSYSEVTAAPARVCPLKLPCRKAIFREVVFSAANVGWAARRCANPVKAGQATQTPERTSHEDPR
ncbi:hypothetical protein [Mesobacterium pallidum]|uniref:hypothetical protein n=1 Tax=Mesobacterium pallidum TaxID=2872037 RepID=UPI001EE23520|nr:hypothetical protein [Mesobacterium pallidum]